MTEIKNIINNLVLTCEKLTLREFTMEIKKIMYPFENFEFMDYFLELAKCENMNSFIVNSNNLFEYDIFCLNNNSDIKVELNNLHLIENEDYKDLLNHKTLEYELHLTPIAFKLCLYNCKLNKNKSILYSKYYLFIEMCVSYFNIYEKLIVEFLMNKKNKKLIEINSEHIDSIGYLHNIMKDQSENIQKLTNIIHEQRKELIELKHNQTNTRNILEKVDDKLIQHCKSFKTLSKKIDNKNILTAKMQHIAVFLDHKNDLKISFNCGAKSYIDGVKKAKLSNGDVDLIDKMITPDGKELRNVCFSKFNEMNNAFKTKLIEEMDFLYVSSDDKSKN